MSSEAQKRAYKKYNAKRRSRPGYREKEADYYYNWYKKNGRERAVDYLEVIKEWHKKNLKAVRAHWLVSYRVSTGKIKKPLICSSCKRKRRLLAHHNNYSKPLEVIWLCSSCHKKLHNSITS